jgi:hypothetical protein
VFPAFSFSLLALLAAMAFIAGGAYSLVGATSRRMPLLLGILVLAFAGLVGCHKKSGSITRPGTPSGTATMTIVGTALDANGNSLGASRSLQFMVEVSP